MMATEDNALAKTIERYVRMIELAETKGEGDEPRTHRLRAELAEMRRGELPAESESDDDREADEPDTELDASCDAAAPLSEIFDEATVRRFFDYGTFEVAGLAQWSYSLMRSMLTPRQVMAARHRLAARGLAAIVGSAEDVMQELPPRTALAVDVRQGVLREDLERISRRYFRRELTQRTASEAMGGPEGKGWHQRFPSSFDRNSDIVSPIGIEEMIRVFWREPWFAGAELVEIPDAKRRRFGARVKIRCGKKEAYDRMDLVDVDPLKGRGTPDGSWIGMSVIFAEVR